MRSLWSRAFALALALSVGAVACSDDPPADKKDTAAPDDVAVDSGAVSDAVEDASWQPPAGKHVSADLSSHIGPLTGTGAFVRKWQASDEGFFVGSAAQARDGDWIIGNAKLRIAIQGPDRHIGVCPWGGNPIDGARLLADGSWSHDEMGEQCLLFNLGRTLKAEHFEVLRDGKDGGPAVLAVTGEDTLLDFINLPSLLASFLGLGTELPLDPDADLPLTITRYYILGAEAEAVKVVTAFRNDGKEAAVIGTGELIDSGGEVEFFNPASNSKGFGSGGGFGAQKMDYIAFRSPHGSHAYAPPLVNGKPGASYLAVGGAAGILLGSDNLLPLLLGGPDAFKKSPAAITIEAGKVVSRSHWMTAGTGAIDTLSAPIWRGRGGKLRAVSGKATDSGGKPVAQARISAILAGAAHTQAVTAADGTFSFQLPEGGKWQLLGYHRGYGLTDPVDVGDAAATLSFGGGGTLAVKVVDAAGKPAPAKVTVYCKSKCPEVPATVRDVGSDRPGAGAWLADFVPMSGQLDIALPAGDYHVIVTRGPTSTLWPASAADGKGEPITISAGKSTAITATILRAVDTSGWLSGDFHVHSVNSPDAPVENVRRVRSFLAEGVDVLVPTDHDFITDMQPIIAAEKGEARLVTLPGIELTTFDYGHFNAFPLQVKAGDLNGGAVDWAGGEGPGMDPPAIQQALSKLGQGGPAFVQLNHPQNYMAAIQVDILGGISLADRAPFRVTAKATDPKTGDTGMWTDAFDGVEILTGHRGGGFGGGDSFAQNLNWWFTLLSRGARWTGTATSDTHRALSSQSGGSRTYVFVGKGKDTPATFDGRLFTDRVLAGQAVGCDGPFIRATAAQGKEQVAVGGTLAVSASSAVTITVDVQGPEWMDLDRVELYVAPTQTWAKPGTAVTDMPAPTATYTFTKAEKVLVDGVDKGAKRYHLKATFTLPKVGADSYVVAIAHGDKAMPAALYGGKQIKPLAFTNPIWLDADGGGYNHPPLTKKVQLEPKPPPPPPLKRPPTYEQLSKVWEALAHHD